jgi:hypothetical protein
VQSTLASGSPVWHWGWFVCYAWARWPRQRNCTGAWFL